MATQRMVLFKCTTVLKIELGVRNEELGVRSWELGVRNEELGIRSLKLQISFGWAAHSYFFLVKYIQTSIIYSVGFTIVPDS
jgi:hypothetical protein